MENEVKNLLRGRRPMDLCGPSNSDLRQRVVSLITGKKTPKSKCGINAMMDLLYDLAKTSKNQCLAVQNKELILWLNN